MESLIYKLRTAGIGIELIGDRIKLAIPEDSDVSALIAEVTRHKRDLISYIRQMKQKSGMNMARPRPVEKMKAYETYHQQKKEYLRFLLLGKHAYNLNFILSFTDADPILLKKALTEVVNRHESLRTTFLRKGGQLLQRVHPVGSYTLRIDFVDLSDKEDRDYIAHTLLRDSKNRQFNFEKEFLHDLKIVHYQGDSWYLSCTIHHAVCDAHSVGILKKEVLAYYNGESASFSSLPLQCRDYARWVNSYMNGPSAMVSGAFYKQTILESLAAESSSAPDPVKARTSAGPSSYRSRLKDELMRSASAGSPDVCKQAYGSVVNLYPEEGAFYRTFITKEKTNGLTGACPGQPSTLFVLLLSSFSILLATEGFSSHLRICIPYTLRIFSELEGIVGWLTSEIIACIPVEAELTAGKLVSKVRNIVLETSAHRFYPHEKIMDDLDIPLHILAPALFNYIDLTDSEMNDHSSFHSQSGSGHFDIHCRIAEYINGFVVEVNYRSGAYSGSRIGQMMNRFTRILRDVLQCPDKPVYLCGW